MGTPANLPGISGATGTLRRCIVGVLVFICCLIGSIETRATPVTVQTVTIPNWQFPQTSPALRIYLNKPIVTSDNKLLSSGNWSSSGSSWYQNITCTVSGGALVIPQITLDSLTDALDVQDARYTAQFYSSATSNQRLGPFAGFESFTVQPVTPVTWASLKQFNSTFIPYVNTTQYSAAAIDAKIAAIVQGSLFIPNTAPVLSETPIAGAANAFAMNSLGAGLLKNQVSGMPAIAVAGTDYQGPLTATAPITYAANVVGVQSSNLAVTGHIHFTAGSGTAALLGLTGVTLDVTSTVVATDRANTYGLFAQTFPAGVNFNLTDPVDATKVAQFNLSNIASGQTWSVNVPNANSTTVQSSTAPANQFATSVSAQGVVGYAQPAFSNISGTATTGQLPAATVYNNTSNTFTTGDQDLSAASSLKLPIGAGLQPTVSGRVAYDSTAQRFGGGFNGSYALFVTPSSTDTLTHKTFDTAGAGNVLDINGNAVNAITGSGSTVVLATSPTLTTPNVGAAVATSITGLTGSLTPNAVGGIPVGSAALPFGSIYIGNAATNNTQITGTVTAARVLTLPDANSNPVQPSTAAANNFATGISSAGVISYAQPSFANLSGNISSSQLGTTATPQFLQLGVNQAAPSVASVGITGANISTQATLAVSSLQSGGNFISNDAGVKTFYDHLLLTTINFGASNANKNLSLFRVDSVNTSLTGLASFLVIDANAGGTSEFKVDNSGNGTFNGNVTVGGNVTVSGGKVNKITITQPATGSTLTIADGKTITLNNTVTVNATDGNTYALPTITDSIAGLAAVQTLTNKTLGNPTTITGPVTMTLGSDATGDIYYRNSGGLLTRLGVGSAGQFVGVSGGIPAWATPSGNGTVNSGTAGQVPIYTGSGTTVGPATNLTYTDASNKFTVTHAGLNSTTADDFLFQNTTAATTTQAQVSQAIHLAGTIFDNGSGQNLSTTTQISKTVDDRIFALGQGGNTSGFAAFSISSVTVNASNPAIVNFGSPHPFATGTLVTISGTAGAGSATINRTWYVRNIPGSPNSVELILASDGTSSVNPGAITNSTGNASRSAQSILGLSSAIAGAVNTINAGVWASNVGNGGLFVGSQTPLASPANLQLSGNFYHTNNAGGVPYSGNNLGGGSTVDYFINNFINITGSATGYNVTNSLGEMALGVSYAPSAGVPNGSAQIAGYFAISSPGAGPTNVGYFAINPALTITTGSNINLGTASEFDINNQASNSPDPGVTAWTVGINIASGGTKNPSAAIYTYSASGNSNNFKHGIWLTGVGNDSPTSGQSPTLLYLGGSNRNIFYGLDFGTGAAGAAGSGAFWNTVGVAIRLPNNIAIVARDAGNANDRALLSYDGSNNVLLGNTNANAAVLQAPSLAGGTVNASTLTLKGTTAATPGGNGNASILLNPISSGVGFGTVLIGASNAEVVNSNDILHLRGPDGANTLLVFDGYNNNFAQHSKLLMREARGTAASPSALLNGDTIGGFACRPGQTTTVNAPFAGFDTGRLFYYAGENIVNAANWGTGLQLSLNSTGNANGVVLHSQWQPNGGYQLNIVQAAPVAADFINTSSSSVIAYMSKVTPGKLVFAVNNGGTIEYLTIVINGSGTTWVAQAGGTAP